MNFQPSTDILTCGIRTTYEQNPDNAQDAIEKYLLKELHYVNFTDRQQVINDLITRFTCNHHSSETIPNVDDDQLLRFFSLLLGHPVDKGELEAEIIQQRLTQALTTIFETLNQLIRTINLTLLEDGQSQETIRFLIGEQLDGSRDITTLEEHLDQIKTAFVTSHRAFKRSVQITVEKILDELDPDSFQETGHSGFKIGLLRKADSFDRYSKSFQDCRKWFDSGRCMQDFLRTFEKQCTEISKLSRR